MADPTLGELFLWAAPAVGFVVHLTLGRYNARKVVADWESLPTALDAERLGQIRSVVECDAETLEIALDSARQARDEGDRDEATRMLGLANRIVAEATPDRLRRLGALSLLVRMACAATPMPPLSAASFRCRRLAGLAALASLAHHLLVSPVERLALRLHVLRGGFAIVRRFLSGCLSRVGLRPDDVRAFRRFEHGAEDFRTLDREHLDAATACLLSLRLQPRVAAVPQRAR